MNRNRRNIPFSVPSITWSDKKAINKALSSPWLTGGPRVVDFEERFAKYVGTKHAIAVNSCTAALHLTLRALNIGSDDEVVVPTFTFAATANAVLYCGARPVFADIDEKTFNINPVDLVKRITARTKAIIVVHYAGQPCDMGEVKRIAREHNLHVVEDCAHSLGATYAGEQTGSLGIAGCFSFYPTKNITTLEGGMVTTDDIKLAGRIAVLKNHGMSKNAWERDNTTTWRYDITELGYNYRLNEIQSALGISQLSRVDKMNHRRISLAGYYTEKLSSINGITVPSESPDREHVFHLYAIRISEREFGMSRDRLFNELSARGIGLSVHYTPLHLLTCYRNIVDKSSGYPVAEKIYSECLSLPMYSKLGYSDIDYIISQIRKLQSYS